MKSLKVATVLAGALAVAGVAGPVFAYDTADLTPSSLNGGLNTLTSTSVKGAMTSLNAGGDPGRLLGGLPLKG